MSSRPPSSTSLDHSTSQETHGEPKDTTTTSPSTLSAEKLKKLPSQVPEAENVLDHPNPSNGNGNEPTYPGPLALGLLMLGICLAAFLVALDRTIVATAIPSITDEFKSPSDVGWYGSAYLLTSCAFQPTYGRVFAHFDVRWSFLGSLGLFELGSLVCGVAPSSKALIVGRAIAGLGSAGIFAGSLVIITLSVPLTKRPVYTAAVGSIFGIGSVCGPIIGGAFTTNVSWRWCFYFNLPVGAFTLVALIIFFHPERRTVSGSFLHRIVDLDLTGNFLLITAVIMLLLALQWGGTTYPWNSATVIGLLTGAGVEIFVFLGWQKYRGESALIPLKIINQRTVAASFGMSFFISGATFVHSYYLPYWFQVIRNYSATRSGVDLIPYVASNFFFAMVAGICVTKSGYVNPPALLGAILATIGSGFITTFKPDISTTRWAGYEILAAAGVGANIQQGIVAVQAVLSPELIPIGTALIIFGQTLSGAVFVSVGSSLLRNELTRDLSKAQLPGVNVTAILAAGATEVREIIPASQLSSVLIVYNNALQKVFTIAIPLAGLALLAAIPMEWKSLKGKPFVGGEA